MLPTQTPFRSPRETKRKAEEGHSDEHSPEGGSSGFNGGGWQRLRGTTGGGRRTNRPTAYAVEKLMSKPVGPPLEMKSKHRSSAGGTNWLHNRPRDHKMQRNHIRKLRAFTGGMQKGNEVQRELEYSTAAGVRDGGSMVPPSRKDTVAAGRPQDPRFRHQQTRREGHTEPPYTPWQLSNGLKTEVLSGEPQHHLSLRTN